MSYEAQTLYEPASAELRFLPEGPVACRPGVVSWVAIQHAADQPQGSLCLLDLASRQNRQWRLPGRPGFAFPTDDPDRFVVGMERELGVFSLVDQQWTVFADGVDSSVEGTIINDGMVFSEGLIFGTKDLEFAEPKASLYLWRAEDRRLIHLRGGQTCSNGKVLLGGPGRWRLWDIDTPTKTVVEYPLDVSNGELGEPRVRVDLRHEPAYPDGMVLTPDRQSLVIAFYDPGDPPYGIARQYSMRGELEAEWRVPGSPRVTCPQWILWDEQVHLVLTTAVEHMPAEQLARHPGAGCLFHAVTPWTEVPPDDIFRLDWL